MQQLGATQLSRVYTAGGGAKNSVWSKMRERYLQVPVVTPVHMEAAYGAALLAMRGLGKEPTTEAQRSQLRAPVEEFEQTGVTQRRGKEVKGGSRPSN